MNNACALLAPPDPVVPTVWECPLNTGLAVLDRMLAAMQHEGDPVALDVTLDFRLLLATSQDATAILREFFRLRALVEAHHYLACYRLRRWLETHFVARVQLDRTTAPRSIALRLADLHSYDALQARCLLAAAEGRSAPPWARVSFAPLSPKTPAPVFA